MGRPRLHQEQVRRPRATMYAKGAWTKRREGQAPALGPSIFPRAAPAARRTRQSMSRSMMARSAWCRFIVAASQWPRSLVTERRTHQWGSMRSAIAAAVCSAPSSPALQISASASTALHRTSGASSASSARWRWAAPCGCCAPSICSMAVVAARRTVCSLWLSSLVTTGSALHAWVLPSCTKASCAVRRTGSASSARRSAMAAVCGVASSPNVPSRRREDTRTLSSGSSSRAALQRAATLEALSIGAPSRAKTWTAALRASASASESAPST
mmetsp:Transcript_106557/g.301422  ORF Transcript_106557/g.301422 Transcript_106557/m.301422 type:complete len:271 (+) Transcript_106557:127-939(+)